MVKETISPLESAVANPVAVSLVDDAWNVTGILASGVYPEPLKSTAAEATSSVPRVTVASA